VHAEAVTGQEGPVDQILTEIPVGIKRANSARKGEIRTILKTGRSAQRLCRGIEVVSASSTLITMVVNTITQLVGDINFAYKFQFR
jgi:hypothetical protein